MARSGAGQARQEGARAPDEPGAGRIAGTESEEAEEEGPPGSVERPGGHAASRPLAPPCAGTEPEEAAEGAAAERHEGAQPEGPEWPSTPALGEGMRGDAGGTEGDSMAARREGAPPEGAEAPSAPAPAESTNGLQPASLKHGEGCSSQPPLPSPKPSLRAIHGDTSQPPGAARQDQLLIPVVSRRQGEARQGDESVPSCDQGARPRREDGVDGVRKTSKGHARNLRPLPLVAPGKEAPPDAGQEGGPANASDDNGEPHTEDDDIKDDEITRLQAILCDLPKHGLYSPESRDIACCGVGGAGGAGNVRALVPAIPDDEDIVGCSNGVIFTAADAVEVALIESSVKYPAYAHVLGRLAVEYADADIVILADHETQRLFLAVRGTDPFTARDLGNDALVFLGMSPVRMENAKRLYAEIRQQFPHYASYGCGHSLGGTIMHDLACDVSKDDGLCFERVDVFNAGGSPLRYKRVASLKETRFHAHRVRGDLVSLYYEPPRPSSPKARSRKIEHPLNPSVSAHRLGHFLPRRRTTMNIIEEKVSSIFACFCMASRDDCRALY